MKSCLSIKEHVNLYLVQSCLHTDLSDSKIVVRQVNDYPHAISDLGPEITLGIKD